MTVEALLRRLRAMDVRLSVDSSGLELRFSAPPGVFTPDLKAEVARRKPALIALLRHETETIEPQIAARKEMAFPLPPAMEGQWLDRRDRSGTVTYTLIFDHPVPAGTEPEVLVAALTQVITRHAALRSTFQERDGDVTQIVGPPRPAVLLPFDAAEDLGAPFDLGHGPLIRFGYSAARQTPLRVAVDHLVFDGQSQIIFQRELADLLAGRSLAPPPPDDARATEAALLTGERGDTARRFWATRLAQLPTTQVPGDSAPSPSGGGRRHLVPLPDTTVQALHRLCARGATPTVAWVSLIAGFLWRHKDLTEPVAIGLAFAGRDTPAAETVIGSFVNVLPVAVRPEAESGIAALGLRIRDEILEILHHQHYPLSRLAADRAQAAHQQGTDLFDAVCMFDTDFAIYELEDAYPHFAAGKFPLLLGLMWLEDKAILNIEYDAGRYGDTWIDRLSRRLPVFIEAAAADPDAPLAQLPLLPAAERHRILDSFNETTRPYPRDLGLAQLLDQALRDEPDRPALSDSSRVLTCAEVRRRIAAIADALRRDGLRPGDIVALAMDRSLEGVLGLLGITWSGGAYLPLDPAFAPETVRGLLAAAGCRHILGDAGGLGKWRELPLDVVLTEICDGETETPPAARDGGDLAYVLYTSGTSGEPKAVMIPQRGVARLAMAGIVEPGEVMAQAAPLAFDASTLEIWGPLLNRGRIHVLAETTLFDPVRLEEELRRGRVSALWLTSSLLNRIVDERPQSFTPLRRLLSGGEALSPPHVAALVRACPNLQVINGYGPTENSAFTTSHAIGAADLTGAPIPIGRPIANTRVYVLDTAGEIVPIGVWGELYAAGDGLALGYGGREDLTAQAFVSVAGIDEPRLYRTGDRVRWRADGILEFGGRTDDQVKIRGHRIETTAVEGALAALTGIKGAAVLAFGEGDDRCLGAVVAADKADRAAWRNALAGVLPAYMIPERFAVVAQLPLKDNGKADRALLSGLLRQNGAGEAEPARRAPRPGLETAVGDAFVQLFDGAQVHAGSDFFELGGHSLKAMRLAALLERDVGIRPTLGELLRARTVEGIARMLDEINTAARHQDLIPLAQGPDYPLSSGQTRLWVVQQLYPDSAAFSIPMAWEIQGALNRDALAQALERLEERHHALRLRFVVRPEDPDGVRQIVVPPGSLQARCLDLDDVAAARRLVAEECARPFAATGSGLARALLLRLNPEGTRHWLLLLVHHAIYDGGSHQILLRDLAAFYRAADQGQAADLPALPRQFEDFAAWQRSRATSAENQARLRRWIERLSPLPEPGPLPQDRHRTGRRRFAGETRRWELGPDLLLRIERQAEAASATLFAVLAALVQILLHRLSGRTDIALGTLVSGRERREVDDLIGYFVNDVVLRQDIDPNRSFAEHLAATQAKLLEVVADQDVAFEDIVRALPGAHDGERSPLFDVMVVWQDDPPDMPLLPGLTLVPLPLSLPFSKFDLTLHFQRSGAQLHCDLEFDTDLFDGETIDAVSARLRHLAEALPFDGPLRDLPLMPDAEIELLRAFNDTAKDMATSRTIPMPFLDRVATAPGAPALLTAEEDSLDYAAFAGRVAGLAKRLREAGVASDDVVVVAMRRSSDMMVAIHGVLLAGAAYCPIDPDLPAARRTSMCEDLGDPWFIADADAAEGLPAHRVIAMGDLTLPIKLRRRAKTNESLRHSRASGNDEKGAVIVACRLFKQRHCEPLGEAIQIGRCSGLLRLKARNDARGGMEPSRVKSAKYRCLAGLTLPDPPLDPHALAYVLFTSGSSGRPKGVEIEHHAVLNRILWMQDTFPIGPGDVILQKTPIGFDVSVWELFWWSWTGAAVAIPPPGVEKDPQALAEAIARYRVTVIHFVPSMLRAFLAALEAGRIEAKDLATLRLVFASGEALDTATVLGFNRLLYARFGTKLHNLYGPTEATVDVTWQPCSPWTDAAIVPIGRPIANVRVAIVDAEDRPLPVGAAGEIVLAGPQVARGYRNRPELSAQCFLPDPATPGGQRYRTGDLGRWRRDGAIEYLGRIDDQVKIRGVRIEPGEIEAALESRDGVRRGLVRAETRDGMTELHAFVLGAPDLTAAMLRDHLRGKLPEAMIPSRFFRIANIPLSANGKVDRKALDGVALDAAPKRKTATGERHQQALTALWQEMLPGVDFGIHDGFFDIGGNSLVLLRLHERIEARWPGVFRVTDLFSCATIAAQAARLAGEDTPGAAEAPFSVAADGGMVAIVGMAVQVAGATDLESLWQDVVEGADRVGPLPPRRQVSARGLAAICGVTLPADCREAAYLDDVDGFDFRRFRFAPADADLLDPEQRLFLETALMALEDAGLGGRASADARVGVYVGGNANPTFRQALARLDDRQAEQAFTLNVPSNIATRLGFLLNWRGPASVIDTACSSGLVAVHAACGDLLAGITDIAVVGAARLILLPRSTGNRLSIESSTARTHAFDALADGTGAGEGAAVFVLKPLARAMAEGDAIHGIIRGSAVNQDGASSGAAAPNPLAQADVIRAAWDRAGADIASVSYIEAHGTGTKLGDPVEIDGLCRAMAGSRTEPGFALIGSAKGNYGHLDSAAGALGLVRATLALAHDTAPPQPFFTTPNPAIDFARAPVRVALRPTPLPDRGTPRRAGISSFGLSGINAHVVIEVPPPASPSPSTDASWVVVALSAGDSTALTFYADALRHRIATTPTLSMADIAMTLASGRDALSRRFAVAVRHRDELLSALDRLLAGDDSATSTVSITRSRHGQRTVPAACARSADALQAAAAFLAGDDLTWPPGQAGRRCHLPPAPFSRQPCHLPPAPPQGEELGGGGTAMGPATGLPNGVAYAIPLNDAAFWPVAEHRLNGRPTLVGMAVPALIAAALAQRGIIGCAIRDLVWHRPLQAGNGAASLILGDDGKAKLGIRDDHGGWCLCAEATVGPAPPPPKTDATLLSTDGLSPRPRQPFTTRFGVIEVSPRWDCHQGEWTAPDGGRALLHLALPAEFDHDRHVFAWHPVLLDLAASLTIVAGMVPYACAAIDLWRPLSPRTVVLLQRQTGDGTTILLCDGDDGTVCARIQGLRFANLGSADTPHLAVPVWRATDAVPASPLPAAILVVGDGEDAADFPACRHLGLDALTAEAIGMADTLLLTLAPGDDLAHRTAQAIRAATATMRHSLRILVLGHGAFGPDGSEQPPDPRWALAAGVILAAAQEYPMHDLRYLDVPLHQAPAAVAAELASPRSSTPWSVWRNGRRFLSTFIPLAIPVAPASVPAKSDLRRHAANAGTEAGATENNSFLQDDAQSETNWPDSGVCVVSGGTGGFAVSLAESWTAGGRVALALLSRRGAPRPETAAAFAALGEQGADIRNYPCDVTDRAALARTLERVRAEQGPITAVIHAAGIPDGGFLAIQDMADFDRVVAIKMEGARNLDALTDADPLQAFVLFASITGLLGAAGTAAYAAANAWLDSFAAWRRSQGRITQSIDWCALREYGMAVRKNAKMYDGWALTPSQAVAAWQAILAGGAVQTVTVDAERMNGHSIFALEPPVLPDATPSSAALEDRIAAIWAEILGYPDIAPEDDFFALGGDSLTGMRIAERLSRVLGKGVTLIDLFGASTPRALAAALGDGAENNADADADAKAAAVDPRRAPTRESYPLAWEQLAVLHSEDAAEMGTAFNLPHIIELPADVDLARLRAALTQLVTRHAALRTRLERRDDSWRMRPIAALDAIPTLLPIDVADHQMFPLAGRDRIRRFALGSELPVRWELLRDPSGRFALFFDIHHALADGFAVETLLGELSLLYAGRPVPALAFDLLDYGWWSREGGGEADLAEAKAYWRRTFAGPLPTLDLPADHPRPAHHTHAIGLSAFALDDPLLQDARAFAAARRITPFTLILTAWTILLHRLAATSDVVIAIPVDSRNATGFAGTVGMMASLLPLRMEVPENITVADLLRRAQESHTQAMGHRAYGLNRLLEDLAPPAAPERTLLSEVSLSYMNYDEDAAERLRETGFTLHGLPRDSGKNDLSIFVRDLPGGIDVTVEYYAAMFSPERLLRFGQMFLTLLGGMIRQPEALVAALPLLDQRGLAEILPLESGLTPPLPLGRGLFTLFAEQAARTPDAPAVADADGGSTYHALLRHAAGIARTLRGHGVGPGDWVAMHVERGRLAVAVMLGVVATGAGYVPLDPANPGDRNRWILEDAGAKVAVVDAAGGQALGDSGIPLIDANACAPTDPAGLDDGGGDALPAALMYTSGSTGRPKGVTVPRRAILRLVFGDDYGRLSASDRVAQAGPLAFDAATYEIWGPLLTGACTCVIGHHALLDPATLTAALIQYRISVMFMTTSLFNRQIDDDASAFRGLRVLLVGGEALSPPHVRRLLETRPDLTLFNVYGPTEVTTFATVHRIRAEDVLPDGLGIPIGRPIAHTQAAILDDAGRRAPIGVWGELFLGGLGLALGYWRNPALTAERFVADPLAPERTLYRTGDRARWRADGTIGFGGRLDTQIKLRGHRIELAEIERVLADAPGVAQVAVILASDQDGGGDLLACVVADAAAPPSALSLRAWAAASLPPYMIPAHWLTVESLPLNTNGKLDTAALKARLPLAHRLDRDPGNADPPATAAERLVARIFAEVFQRPITSRAANFIELGGHSLLAIRIVNRLAQQGAARIPMAAFFADPSVTGLARHLDGSAVGDQPVPPAIPLAPQAETYPASHGQQRLYLLQGLDPESAAYVMLFAFRCAGTLSSVRLGEALALLAVRHDSLRTGFSSVDGRIVQWVGEGLPVLVENDLCGHADPKDEALRLARGEAATPFDLTHPPLLRARVIRLGDDESLLLLALHHIVGDGWSARILVDELSALYAALSEGRPPLLPPLPITYKDYASWQHGRDWSIEEGLWRQRLSGAPTAIALPTDHPPRSLQSFRGGARHRDLPPAVTSGLHALAEKSGASMAAVGLAVFAAMLYRLTRQTDMVVGMGVAGRDHLETEGLIGFFVNVLPIRIRLDDDTDFADLLDTVKDAVTAALDCRDYPFDLLVRALAPQRSGNRQPLLNVVFEYHRFEGVRDHAGPGLPELPPGTPGLLDDSLSEIIDSRTTKHDLIAFFEETAGQARLTLEYDSDLFAAATMEKWLGYFIAFADMAIASSNGTTPS